MRLAKAEVAEEPKNENVKKVAWVYSAALVLIVLGQLYAFEKFIPLIEAYALPGGEGTATLVATIIVIAEIFALPFLLRMPLSPLMRYVSMFLGSLVPVMWILLSIVALINGDIENAGILGAKVEISAAAQTLLALLLSGLSIWSVWGLFPSKKI